MVQLNVYLTVFIVNICIDYTAIQMQSFHCTFTALSLQRFAVHSKHTAVENCVRDFVNVSVGLEVN